MTFVHILIQNVQNINLWLLNIFSSVQRFQKFRDYSL